MDSNFLLTAVGIENCFGHKNKPIHHLGQAYSNCTEIWSNLLSLGF